MRGLAQRLQRGETASRHRQQDADIAGETVSGTWPAAAGRCWMTASQVVQEWVAAQTDKGRTASGIRAAILGQLSEIFSAKSAAWPKTSSSIEAIDQSLGLISRGQAKPRRFDISTIKFIL
jgi:hypothetical protein